MLNNTEVLVAKDLLPSSSSNVTYLIVIGINITINVANTHDKNMGTKTRNFKIAAKTQKEYDDVWD